MRFLLLFLALIILPEPGTAQNLTREVYLMGTSCSLTVFSDDRTRSLDRVEQFIRVLEEAERELSTWREGSALTALNRQPVGTPVRPDWAFPGFSQNCCTGCPKPAEHLIPGWAR
jgi:thiamine biosynthesis lipoprotein ApbE